MKLPLLLLSGSIIYFAGCQTYQYRVLQPQGVTQPITDQPVLLHYDPLEYRLQRYKDRLAMQITNPTDDRLVLLVDRSYVVDSHGESHPLQTLVLGPRSFTRMLVPPIPISFPYTDWSWGWPYGWGWGPYYAFGGPYWGPTYYGPPPISYYQVYTQYDWAWKTGPARLHLTYDHNRTTFEHDLEVIREPQK